MSLMRTPPSVELSQVVYRRGSRVFWPENPRNLRALQNRQCKPYSTVEPHIISGACSPLVPVSALTKTTYAAGGHGRVMARPSATRTPRSAAAPSGAFSHRRSEDVGEAIDAAAGAFRLWRRTASRSPAVRRRISDAAERFARRDRAHHHAGERQDDPGVARRSGLRVDRGRPPPAAGRGFFDERSGPAEVPDKTWVKLEPVGVAGTISPWNFPMNVMCRKTLPALLTGNTVVFKPATFTPWSGIFMARLFEAGISARRLQLRHRPGSAIGNASSRSSRPRRVVHGIDRSRQKIQSTRPRT